MDSGVADSQAVKCRSQSAGNPTTGVPGNGTTATRASQSSAAIAAANARRSIRLLHVPPVATELQIYKQGANDKPTSAKGDEDEGIQYVENLQVVGGVLGTLMKCSGDFVGTPTVQWYRMRHTNGQLATFFVEIPGATELEYNPNADDVGTVMRIEATSTTRTCGGRSQRASTAAEMISVTQCPLRF